MKTFAFLTLCLLMVVAAAGVWLLSDEQRRLNEPMTADGESFDVLVKPGMTLREVATELNGRGILQNPRSLVWFARWHKLSTKIKAGEYEVAASTTPVELLDLLIAGKVRQWSFTIIEGWTFKQLRSELGTHDKLVHTLSDLDDAAVMSLLGHPDVHPEGWFYADTYYFPAGTTDVQFLRRALGKMHETLSAEWESRAENLPYQQPYHALILASIVERETAAVHERGDIAGVFVRRLRKGMKLEADPTVIYGLGDDFDGNLTRKDLKTDTPYNTYTRRGLPPTPIAIPSGDAVRAALNPAHGKALFFVARGDGTGTHQFSETYAEHEKAVQAYLKALRKSNSGSAEG